MSSNASHDYLEQYEKQIQRWLKDYECWKLCYSYCNGITNKLDIETNQEVLNTILNKLSTPKELTQFQIIFLILYQIETSTYIENIQLLTNLVSNIWEGEFEALAEGSQFTSLKHHMKLMILNCPPVLVETVKRYSINALDNKLDDLHIDKTDQAYIIEELKKETFLFNLKTGLELSDNEPMLNEAEASDKSSVCDQSPTKTAADETSPNSKAVKSKYFENHQENFSDMDTELDIESGPSSIISQRQKAKESISSEEDIFNFVPTRKIRKLHNVDQRLVEISPVINSKVSPKKDSFKTPTDGEKNRKKRKTKQNGSINVSSASTTGYELRSYLSSSRSTSMFDRVSPRRQILTIHPKKKKRVQWSLEEEEALVLGVKRHGIGSWKCIIDNTNVLENRSVRDCYDKWKNITNYGHLEDIKARAARKKRRA